MKLETVLTQAIGFSYSVTIEKEIRAKTGAKYPDKTVVKATLSGHADKMLDAVQDLKLCAEAVKKQIAQLEAE